MRINPGREIPVRHVDERPPVRTIVLRVLLPLGVLAVGTLLVLLRAWTTTFGGGALSPLWWFVTFFAVAGACGVFFTWSSWPWTGMLVAGLLFTSTLFAGSAVHATWLAAHGVTSTCQVTSADQRTYREWVGSGGADGTADNGHFETRVVYLHHLRCPAGGPTQLSRAHLLAYDGESLQVVWDRTGHVGPVPASERRGVWESWRSLLIVDGLAALVLLLEALIDLVRYPRRSPWDFDWPGLAGQSFMRLAERW